MKIRLAVAVSESGEWNCRSQGWQSDADKLFDAKRPFTKPDVYWIEVELPRREIPVVQGLVVNND